MSSKLVNPLFVRKMPLSKPPKKVPAVPGLRVAPIFAPRAPPPQRSTCLRCPANMPLVKYMADYMSRVHKAYKGPHRAAKLDFARATIARIRAYSREITMQDAMNFDGWKTSRRLRNVIAREFALLRSPLCFPAITRLTASHPRHTPRAQAPRASS